MPELAPTYRKTCWCCGLPLPVAPVWWTEEFGDREFCLLCDGPESQLTCPPHVCEKSDRRFVCDAPHQH
jgi:hypothetical protein